MDVTDKIRSLSQRMTLVDQVYDILRNQILNMELAPGRRLKN